MQNSSTHKEEATVRLALLIDDFSQPKWVWRTIEEINQKDDTEIVLVIYWPRRTSESHKFIRKIPLSISNLLWTFYQKLDSLLFHPSNSALEKCDITPLIRNCPKWSVNFYQDSISYFERAKEFETFAVDVILQFGASLPNHQLPIKARHGIWFYRWGDNISYRGEPACFWETFFNNPTISITLELQADELARSKTLDQIWCETDSISVMRNRNRLLWSSLGMMCRNLGILHSQGESALAELSSRFEYRPYTGPLYSAPTNTRMLLFLGKLLWRMTHRIIINHFFDQQWCLAYKIDSSSAPPEFLYDVNYLIPPSDRFWADPFPIEAHENYFIFIEEYMYRDRKAHISVIEMDKLGRWKPPAKVLERDYHLSYPFVFSWMGNYYMIPETEGSRSIELYKCSEFPFRWQFDRVLISNISAVDTTLFFHDDKWWMFTNIRNDEEPTNWNKLHLFHADCPFGPWYEHKKNPIIRDLRNARPAGRLFSFGGNIYRPAQDSSGRYGRAISFRKITRLNTSEYSEEETGRIEPALNGETFKAVHTFNQVGSLITIDWMRVKSKRDRLIGLE